MARTYRRDYKTGMVERDGYKHENSVLCHHNNWCPWCRRNRTFSRLPSKEWELTYGTDSVVEEYDYLFRDWSNTGAHMWYELEVDGGEGIYVGTQEQMENLKATFEAQGYSCQPLKAIVVDSYDEMVW